MFYHKNTIDIAMEKTKIPSFFGMDEISFKKAFEE